MSSQSALLPGMGGIYGKNSNFLVSAYSAPNDTLDSLYMATKCGLNYESSSLVLGKKMTVYGLPYPGIDQPAPFSVSSIPAGGVIEKAFLWWEITGDDTTSNVIIEAPSSAKDTFPGELIAYGNRCWGPTSAYRAEVTSIIESNGTYKISGLPTDTTFVLEDVQGATLFVIFSDTLASFLGHLNVHDGYMLAVHDTIYESVDNMNVDSTISGKAFMLVTDFQNQSGNALKMNNGPLLGVVQNYWDFEEKNTTYVQGQKNSQFGLASPGDCSNLLCIGTYYKEPYSLIGPTITQVLDTLTSTPALSYQWYLNDTAISGATDSSFVAGVSGNYKVVVGLANSACYAASSNYSLVTCEDQIQPNVNFLGDSLWTDSTGYALQWYHEDTLLPGANGLYFIAVNGGVYKLHAVDTAGNGCSAFSDTVQVYYTGWQNFELGKSLSIYPNPTNTSFTIDYNSNIKEKVMVRIYSLEGKLVLKKIVDFDNSYKQHTINVERLSPGIYSLVAESINSSIAKKLVIMQR